MATAPIYIRAVLYNGSTPVKIMTGAPEQLNLNIPSGHEMRVAPADLLDTASAPAKEVLPEDDRLIIPG